MLARVGRCVSVIQSSRKPRRMSSSTKRADVDCRSGAAVGVTEEEPNCLSTWEARMLHRRGFGGASSRALHSDRKPLFLCEPSQKGLFSASPQRQREITERPPSP